MTNIAIDLESVTGGPKLSNPIDDIRAALESYMQVPGNYYVADVLDDHGWVATWHPITITPDPFRLRWRSPVAAHRSMLEAIERGREVLRSALERADASPLFEDWGTPAPAAPSGQFWYVDGAAGDDSDDGTRQSPLKTLEELRRRLGIDEGPIRVSAGTNVYLANCRVTKDTPLAVARDATFNLDHCIVDQA